MTVYPQFPMHPPQGGAASTGAMRRPQRQGERRLQPQGEQPRERQPTHGSRGRNAKRLGVATTVGQSSHTQEDDAASETSSGRGNEEQVEQQGVAEVVLDP